MSKIGRNDLCWCGSGKKFKKCHINRANQPPVPMDEILRREKKSQSRRICLHPEAGPGACEGGIIKAHTLQRSGVLTRIARAGHVLGFIPEIPVLERTNGRIEAKSLGIGKASTFTGYCKKHDKEHFKALEDFEFEGSALQLFLLGHRAVAVELYKKETMIDSSLLLGDLDRGKGIQSQLRIQFHARAMAEGAGLGIRDMRERMRAFNKMWKSGEWDDLQYGVLEFDRHPTIASCGVVTPDCDFAGRRIQHWGVKSTDPAPDYLCFSLISTPKGGAAIWCWVGDCPASEDFVRSLFSLEDSVLANAVVQFAFESLENTFASPDWWEGLDREDQQVLLDRMWGQPIGVEPLNRLVPDGRKYADWGRVTKRSSSGLTP